MISQDLVKFKPQSPICILDLSLLEHLLDEFDGDKGINSHLDPEAPDANGDCLFHLVARAKYSSHVLKVGVCQTI